MSMLQGENRIEVSSCELSQVWLLGSLITLQAWILKLFASLLFTFVPTASSTLSLQPACRTI